MFWHVTCCTCSLWRTQVFVKKSKYWNFSDIIVIIESNKLIFGMSEIWWFVLWCFNISSNAEISLLTNRFVAEKLSLPYLSAYLDSIGTNFRHGANFATGGSTIQPVDIKIFGAGFSPISLQIQLLQFKQFKARTEELFKEGQVWFLEMQNNGVKFETETWV